jgi:hypothetical protein
MLSTCPCQVLGLPSLLNCEANKVLFFVNFLVANVFYQQKTNSDISKRKVNTITGYIKKKQFCWALVSRACNPSYLEGRDWADSSLKSAPGKYFMRPYLEKTHHKLGLAEWLESKTAWLASIKPWVQTPVLTKKKKKKRKEKRTYKNSETWLRPSLRFHGVEEVTEVRTKGIKNLFSEIIAQNLQTLGKNIDI